jgi:ABC-type glycerol-3-phosphate transport system substrate-binding protein
MKRGLFMVGCLGAAFCIAGCSTVQQTATTSSDGTNQVRTTTLRVSTLGDAKQVIQSLRASNGSTHSLGAAGIEQQTTSDLMLQVIRTAIEAGKAAAK